MNIIEIKWNWRTGLAARARTDYIVLHHAAAVTCTAQQVDNWHKGNGWTGIGYHFFVCKNGSVYSGRPLWAMGAHAEGKNNISIGICVEGNYDIEKTMPENQKRAVKELLTYLKGKYPKAELKGHREVGATGCPGKYYPFEDMKAHWNNKTNKESENLTMSQYEELKKEIDVLKARVGYFNYIDKNMNDSYKPTIQKLVSIGVLKGNENGELMLTTDMMRIFTVLDRVGIFD